MNKMKFTPEELKEKIEEYFNKKKEDKRLPTFAGLARYIGVHRQSIYKWEKKDNYSDIIKEARTRLLEVIEDKLLNEDKVAGTIFLAKNYGYSDRITKEHEVGGSLHKVLKDAFGVENSK